MRCSKIVQTRSRGVFHRPAGASGIEATVHRRAFRSRPNRRLVAASLFCVPGRQHGTGSTKRAEARMRFHADLHVHSKYSRATSRDLDLEHLAQWACRKGIGVVATGDFTHPRSEEHTSELQSRVELVCRLLLEKKKKH